jgi:hypothetical protein
MSRLDEITLYCEDEDGRPTGRLLFVALQELAPEIPIARLIAPSPTGSKEDVKVRVRHARRDGVRAFGLRDRDFLERRVVDDFRGKAFRADRGTAEAWPLGRYCIESYLLDPAFLAGALAYRTEAEWGALVTELSAARYWLDLVRATLTDVRWRWTQIERKSPAVGLSTREEAITVLLARHREMVEKVRDMCSADVARAKFESLETDFAEDGPLAHRVDGKRMLHDLEERLVSEGRSAARGLTGMLLLRAERNACPRALLEELRPLLRDVEATYGTRRS